MRSLLPIVLGMAVLLGPAAAPGEACQCVEPRGCDADDADALFVGRILEVSEGPVGVVARVLVERAVRGAAAGQVRAIRTAGGPSHCRLFFRRGDRWLIAADRVEAGSAAWYRAHHCGGSFQVREGEPGPRFPTRSDVGGRVTRYTDSRRADRSRVVNVRVWVDTPAGVVATRTDTDGDFLLRNVPLDPPHPLHVDLPSGEEIRDVRLGVWTPEACRLLDVIVQPAGMGRAR